MSGCSAAQRLIASISPCRTGSSCDRLSPSATISPPRARIASARFGAVAAGAEDVRDAKSTYYPQVDIGLAGAAIDENHAIAALGNYPMYAAGSLTLTQLIWSDGASANITIQKELQHVRQLDLDAIRDGLLEDVRDLDRFWIEPVCPIGGRAF